MNKTVRPCNPKEIDDAGMSPAQFRIYFRVVRRAGNGWCYETSQEMAQGCCMSKPTVLSALKWLTDNKFIEKDGTYRNKKYRPLVKEIDPLGDSIGKGDLPIEPPLVKNRPPLVKEIDPSEIPIGKEYTSIGKKYTSIGKKCTPKGITIRDNHKENPPLPPPTQERGRGRNDLEELKTKINALRPEWQKPARWGYSEEHHLFSGAAAQMAELDDSDWGLLEQFMRYRKKAGEDYWIPYNRDKFSETFAQVWASCQRWAGKKGKKIPAQINGNSDSKTLWK